MKEAHSFLSGLRDLLIPNPESALTLEVGRVDLIGSKEGGRPDEKATP